VSNRPRTQGLQRLIGGAVLALDGDIGAVRDFYFDEDTWTVRHVIVETGKWLHGRSVLLSLWALHAPDWEQCRIPVKLTRKQVRHSPGIDTHRPVSRKMEAASLSYYGYPLYWGGPALWGLVPAPGLTAAAPPPSPLLPPEQGDDSHLRSCREVTGYHIRARDGEIGHIDDFFIDPDTWAIEHLLIDTSNWIGGRSVLVSPTSVQRVSWLERIVELSISRDAVARSPTPQHVA
jgi:uncharacterized protein YrrD